VAQAYGLLRSGRRSTRGGSPNSACAFLDGAYQRLATVITAAAGKPRSEKAPRREIISHFIHRNLLPVCKISRKDYGQF
jgi:hypothetical protein